jgi:hypothetical protein
VMSFPSESLRDPDAAPRQYAAIRYIKVEQGLASTESEIKGYGTISDTIVVLFAYNELDRWPVFDRR